MTVNQALQKHKNIEIELLLMHVLHKSREFFYLNPKFNITNKQYNTLTKLVKRREKGEPIAYILGYKDFYSLRFKVNKDVLIPRPETEMVIDLVVSCELRMARSKPIKILDVGTGSGCIAISLANKLKAGSYNFEMYASDVSKKALAVAKQNAKANRVKIKFIHSNLLSKIRFTPDIIIANLPYGWKEWKNNSSAATVGLKFEPQMALFTKESGLYLYRKLLMQISALSPLPSLIYLEIDPRQKKDIGKLIKKILPKSKIIFHKDFANKWRYAEITV